jgi:hypothetical protein
VADGRTSPGRAPFVSQIHCYGRRSDRAQLWSWHGCMGTQWVVEEHRLGGLRHASHHPRFHHTLHFSVVRHRCTIIRQRYVTSGLFEKTQASVYHYPATPTSPTQATSSRSPPLPCRAHTYRAPFLLQSAWLPWSAPCVCYKQRYQQ